MGHQVDIVSQQFVWRVDDVFVIVSLLLSSLVFTQLFL